MMTVQSSRLQLPLLLFWIAFALAASWTYQQYFQMNT